MKVILLIAIGGGIGSVFRFLISKFIHSLLGGTFPYGTLCVNIIGSFLIGFISWLLFERIAHLSESLRPLLIIGLLGGFTTFSTFSLESVSLWENKEFFKASLYITLSIVLCLISLWSGLTLGRKI